MKTEIESELRNYIIAKNNAKALFESLKLESRIQSANFVSKAMDSGNWEHNAYLVGIQSLSRPAPLVTFAWRAGMGIEGKPSGYEVLANCCRDYLSAKDAGSWEDFAGEMGYDADSRKGEQVYRDCLEIGAKLKQLNLSAANVRKFADLANQF